MPSAHLSQQTIARVMSTPQAVEHLEPLPPDLQGQDLNFLGPKIDPATATRIARGEVDPISKKPFEDPAEPATGVSTAVTPSRRTFLSASAKRKRAAATPDRGQKSMMSFLRKPSTGAQRAFKRPRKQNDSASATTGPDKRTSSPPSSAPPPTPPPPSAENTHQTVRRSKTTVRRSKFFGAPATENKSANQPARRKKGEVKKHGPSPLATAAKFGGIKLHNFVSPCVNSKFKIFSDSKAHDLSAVQQSVLSSDSPPEIESPPQSQPASNDTQPTSNEDDDLSSDELNMP